MPPLLQTHLVEHSGISVVRYAVQPQMFFLKILWGGGEHDASSLSLPPNTCSLLAIQFVLYKCMFGCGSMNWYCNYMCRHKPSPRKRHAIGKAAKEFKKVLHMYSMIWAQYRSPQGSTTTTSWALHFHCTLPLLDSLACTSSLNMVTNFNNVSSINVCCIHYMGGPTNKPLTVTQELFLQKVVGTGRMLDYTDYHSYKVFTDMGCAV